MRLLSAYLNGDSHLLTLARIGVVITLVAHIIALTLSDLDAAASPISQLSRGDTAWIHSVGLISLAMTWGFLVRTLWNIEDGRLWRLGCTLLLLCIPIVLYVAYYFATATDTALFGPNANDPLSVLASAIGISMGALQVGLKRLNTALAHTNLVILLLWLGLIPIIPFIGPGGLGTYERSVGALMLIWTALLTVAPRLAARDIRPSL